MNTPEYFKYNTLDLWVNIEGSRATIGITDYAQDQLADVVYADIKVSPGDILQKGKLIAVVESVKASSDIDAPISGKVLEINNELGSSPEIINADPYGRAWIIQIEISHQDEISKLMDASAYREYRGKES